MQERRKERERNEWRKKEERKSGTEGEETGRWVLEERRSNGSKEREGKLPDEIILQLKISLLIQQRCNMS